MDVLAAGCHLEGPFISTEKKGAHLQEFIRSFSSAGVEDLMEVYGSLDNVAIVTLAPELPGSQAVVTELSKRGITVSLGEHRLLHQSDSFFFHRRASHSDPSAWFCFLVEGHSVADLSQAEDAVQHGASFITHLFNAMLPVSPSCHRKHMKASTGLFTPFLLPL